MIIVEAANILIFNLDYDASNSNIACLIGKHNFNSI